MKLKQVGTLSIAQRLLAQTEKELTKLESGRTVEVNFQPECADGSDGNRLLFTVPKTKHFVQIVVKAHEPRPNESIFVFAHDVPGSSGGGRSYYFHDDAKSTKKAIAGLARYIAEELAKV